MHRALRVLALSVVAHAVLYAAACGSDSGGLPASPYHPPDVSDVVFVSGTDAAALVLMLETPLLQDPLAGAMPVNPPDLTILPPTPPTIFTWRQGAAAAPDGGSHFGQLLPSQPPAARQAPDLLEVLLGERRAQADEGSFSGEGFFLSFTIQTADDPPKDFPVLRVFTSGTTYQPDASAWSKITKSGSWVTLTITSASFDADAIVSGKGPFPPQKTIKFCADW